MSVPSGYIRCHGCDYQGVMQYRPITLRYMLPDGVTVDSHRTFGWCNNCEAIRDVELSLDADAIRKELDVLKQKQQPSVGFLRNAIDRVLGGKQNEAQAELLELTKLLRFAEIRSSPPRCLTCGEASVVYIAFDDQGTSSNFVHTCGGRLYQVPAEPDAPRFSYRPEVLLLDVEGCRQ
jgi:hypothetical protein